MRADLTPPPQRENIPMSAAIRELRGHLGVAMSGVEAFLEQKIEPSDGQLAAVVAALREVHLLLDDLPHDHTVTFETHVVPIDICRLLTCHVGAMESLAAQRGVRLTIEGCAMTHLESAQFVGDPVRIAEIVTNVVLNAIRYTPPSGEVHVSHRRDPTNLRLCVADEGPGIEFAERTRIFESGYRGRSRASLPGSGIGLALVKQFVDRQGGTIAVSDGRRCGAVFTIDLPGTLAAQHAAAGAPRRTATAFDRQHTSVSL